MAGGGGGVWGWDGKVTGNVSDDGKVGCFKMTKSDNYKIFCYNLIFIDFLYRSKTISNVGYLITIYFLLSVETIDL